LKVPTLERMHGKCDAPPSKFIETAKLTRSETLPLKLVDQAALVNRPPW